MHVSMDFIHAEKPHACNMFLGFCLLIRCFQWRHKQIIYWRKHENQSSAHCCSLSLYPLLSNRLQTVNYRETVIRLPSRRRSSAHGNAPVHLMAAAPLARHPEVHDHRREHRLFSTNQPNRFCKRCRKRFLCQWKRCFHIKEWNAQETVTRVQQLVPELMQLIFSRGKWSFIDNI